MRKMLYPQPGIRSRKWDAQHSLGFWDTKVSSNLGLTIRPSKEKSKVGDHSRGWPECSLFNSYYTEV